MKLRSTIVSLGALALFSVGAAEPVETTPPAAPPKPAHAVPGRPESRPPRRQGPPWRLNQESFRRGPGVWRAFARLSPAEQQELMKLQRENPDKFRSVMQEKADELFRREKSKWDELKALAERCRTCGDQTAKEALRKELRGKLGEDFNERLKHSREDLETFKRRVERMEAELRKREKNADAIVDAMLERMLSATTPQPPPRP